MGKRSKLPLRVIKGGFEPASKEAVELLRERRYSIGDLVFADLTKPRNPGFNRLAHALGGLLAENLDTFDGMPAHKVLKRLQWEANTGCDEVGAMVEGVGMVQVKFPRSLSYESMSEEEFREVYQAMCNHVAKHYWHDLEAADVAEMVNEFLAQ